MILVLKEQPTLGKRLKFVVYLGTDVLLCSVYDLQLNSIHVLYTPTNEISLTQMRSETRYTWILLARRAGKREQRDVSVQIFQIDDQRVSCGRRIYEREVPYSVYRYLIIVEMVKKTYSSE